MCLFTLQYDGSRGGGGGEADKSDGEDGQMASDIINGREMHTKTTNLVKFLNFGYVV